MNGSPSPQYYVGSIWNHHFHMESETLVHLSACSNCQDRSHIAVLLQIFM